MELLFFILVKNKFKIPNCVLCSMLDGKKMEIRYLNRNLPKVSECSRSLDLTLLYDPDTLDCDISAFMREPLRSKLLQSISHLFTRLFCANCLKIVANSRVLLFWEINSRQGHRREMRDRVHSKS